MDRKIAITKTHARVERPAKQFLESEGVILEFYGKWDDSSSYYGVPHRLVCVCLQTS